MVSALILRSLWGWSTDIAFFSCARHITFTVSLHPGVQIGTGNCNAGGNPVRGDGLASHPGWGGGGKKYSQGHQPSGLYADLTFTYKMHKMHCYGADDDI